MSVSDETSISLSALELAIRSEMPHGAAVPPDTERVIERATEYRAFLQGEV